MEVDGASSQHVHNIIAQVFSAGAFEGSLTYFTPSDDAGRAVLTELREHGAMQDCFHANGELLGWQFTNFGLKNASFGRLLHSPTYFFDVPTVKWTSSWTTLNCLVALRDEGWQVERWRHDKLRPPPLSLAGALVKVFYIGRTAVTVGDKYVAVMARAMDKTWIRTLISEGISSVEHLSDAGYYSALLEGNHLKIRQADMTNDHGLGDDPVEEKIVRQGRAKKPVKFRLSESFAWGKVSFKYKPPKNSRSKAYLQADCPRKSHIRYHSKGRTMCCLTLGFRTQEEQDRVILRLKAWASACKNYDTWQEHYKLKVPDPLPTEEALEAAMIPCDDPDTADEDIPHKPPRRRRAAKKHCPRGPKGRLPAAAPIVKVGAAAPKDPLASSSSSSSIQSASSEEEGSSSDGEDSDSD